jgi:hypothetical protein
LISTTDLLGKQKGDNIVPNWCNNAVIIEHENTYMIDKIEKACKDGNLLAVLRPLPGGEWNYDWCVSNWGTKWDVDPHYYNREGNSISISFDSAWSPPIEAYQFAESELGYYIRAYYIESGMCFSGEYESGELWDRGYPTDKNDLEKYLDECSDDMIVELGLEEYFEWLLEDEE